MSYRYRTNSQSSNNSSDGLGNAKRRKQWWSNKPRANESGVKRNRMGGSETFDIDTPIFKEPAPRSASSRNMSRYNDTAYNRDGDMYSYNDQQYNRGDRHNYDDEHRPSDSSRRNWQGSSPAQPRKSQAPRTSFLEPEHAGPASNWDKYINNVHNWQDKHKLAYYKSRCMALEFENQMLFEQVKSLIEENILIAAERGETPTMLLPNFPGQLSGFEEVDRTVAEKRSPAARSSKNKDKERKEEAAREEKEKEDEKAQEIKNQMVKEPKGFKRKEEMEQLYGENAGLIQSLETAVQHSFNRSCDTYNPQLWMTLPINTEAVE